MSALGWSANQLKKGEFV